MKPTKEQFAKIHESGMRARTGGIKLSQCPFHNRSTAAYWWRRGWADQAASEKKSA